MKLYVIAGHGDGDPGAYGHGYHEAERVRVLAASIKKQGGDAVKVHDTKDNAYASGAINTLSLGKDWAIIELHMDADSTGTARGAHVIIKAGIGGADAYDKKLAEYLADIFPGRARTIVERNDLANPSRAAARGFNYRLVECGFISNKQDLATFNAKVDEIAKVILAAFGISTTGATVSTKQATKPVAEATQSASKIDTLAQEVIDGKHGNGEARKKSLGADYAAVQARVNELLGVKVSSGSTSTAASGTIDRLAREVIAGKYGNGETRRKALGSNYAAVQARVNELLGY